MTSAKSVTNLSDRCLRERNLIGEHLSKYFKAIDTSQVLWYLGRFGLVLYTLLMNLFVSGDCPKGGLSKMIERADFAVLMAL